MVATKISKVYPKDSEAAPAGVDDMRRFSYIHEPVNVQEQMHVNTIENPNAQVVQDVTMSSFPQSVQCSPPQHDHTESSVHVVEDPNPQARQFFDMLKAANTPLYHGCENHTQLSMIGRLTNLMTNFRMTERLYDELCTLLREVLPKDNTMTIDFYDTKKQLSALGLTVERIDCCENGCMIYWGMHADENRCHVCHTLRWRKKKNGEKVPKKQFHYFPLTPRLQRLYASEATARHMRWHAEHNSKDGEMCHPSESEAWLDFNARHSDFACETRNVRLGLCTYDFNPFGNSGQQYSLRPVIVTPYNLPPDMCMKNPYMFLSVIVPGPNNPKLNIDLYLQPLIHELRFLWDQGIQTYDVSTRQNFQLRAALMWTIGDFPTYGMLSGWSTSGHNACPHCMLDSQTIYLKHSRKVSWFDSHRRFLPYNHPFRSNRTDFMPGVVERKNRPSVHTGDQLLDDLNRYGLLRMHEDDAMEYNARISRYCGGWKKMSIFWDLPYWKTNKIRHNLDIMHIEKKIFENIFNTLMCVKNKTMDNFNARQDMEELGMRSDLHPLGTSIPKAFYTLSDQQMDVLLEWLKTLRFPDGYVSNLSRKIDMNKHELFGMKSHDCHVFMQRLIPVAFRELLPLKVWEAITEMSLFFKGLTCAKLKVTDLEKLEDEIPLILCKLEQIFPPALFNCMVHLPVHLPYEARIAGPAQYRWVYPFEQYLRHLNINVINKADVEALICDAYLTQEASHFVSHYFNQDVSCRVRDLPINDDDGYDNNTSGVLSIFTNPVRFHGKGKITTLDATDYKIAHTYILSHCKEVNPYREGFKSLCRNRFSLSSSEDIDTIVEDCFADWFQSFAREGHLDNVENGYILKHVAEGPLKQARSYDACFVNGYKFHTIYHASEKSTSNSGVCMKMDDNNGDEDDWYGNLQEIYELEYPIVPIKRVTLFKCLWYDPTRTGYGHGTNVHERYKLVDVHLGRLHRKYRPFALANQTSQVYYHSYPSTRQNLNNWRAVFKVKPIKIQVGAIAHIDSTNSAYQDEQTSDATVERDVFTSHGTLRDPCGGFIQFDDVDAHITDENEDDDKEHVLSSSDDEAECDYDDGDDN